MCNGQPSDESVHVPQVCIKILLKYSKLVHKPGQQLLQHYCIGINRQKQIYDALGNGPSKKPIEKHFK